MGHFVGYCSSFRYWGCEWRHNDLKILVKNFSRRHEFSRSKNQLKMSGSTAKSGIESWPAIREAIAYFNVIPKCEHSSFRCIPQPPHLTDIFSEGDIQGRNCWRIQSILIQAVFSLSKLLYSPKISKGHTSLDLERH